MEFVRGPSWIPVRLAWGFQAFCVIAFVLSVCFFAILITADFLINPEVGSSKIVIASLIGMICPTGLASTLLALPLVTLAKRWPVLLRQIVAGLPWLLLSHPALSLLPTLY